MSVFWPRRELPLLPIGYDSIVTSKGGYEKLIEFYDACRQYEKKDLLIDFRNLSWIDPNMTAMLSAIIYQLGIERRVNCYVDGQHIKKNFRHLYENGFLGEGATSKTSVRLNQFNPGDDEKFIQYINKELLSHPAFSKMRTSKQELLLHFLEIFCNVEKHAQTQKPLFACGQYFEKNRELRFSLVDLGIGYFEPIQDYTKGEIKTPADAIFWALDGSNSTKTDAPGGLGLKELKKFCDKTKSRFQIISNGGFWQNRSNKVRDSKLFPGSQTNIVFNCEYL